MIDRLVTALQALATGGSTPDAQDTVGGLADALLLVRQCQGLELTAYQRSVLDQLDRSLDSVGPDSGRQNEDAGWQDIRRLAREALTALTSPL